jgi:hypothetical protein
MMPQGTNPAGYCRRTDLPIRVPVFCTPGSAGARHAVWAIDASAGLGLPPTDGLLARVSP